MEILKIYGRKGGLIERGGYYNTQILMVCGLLLMG
jgi:hypothetical protein